MSQKNDGPITNIKTDSIQEIVEFTFAGLYNELKALLFWEGVVTGRVAKVYRG